MAFAPGMYVFPGGGVDDADSDADIPGRALRRRSGPSGSAAPRTSRAGWSVRRCARRSRSQASCSPGPTSDSVVADTSAGSFQEARLALEARELTFGAYLADAGLVLRADLLGRLVALDHPDRSSRGAIDTRFFVAVLPEGQAVGELAREADRALWAPLSDVLAAVDAGGAAMLPPTYVTCREVSEFAASEVLAAAGKRDIPTIEPELVDHDGELFLETDLGDLA